MLVWRLLVLDCSACLPEYPYYPVYFGGCCYNGIDGYGNVDYPDYSYDRLDAFIYL